MKPGWRTHPDNLDCMVWLDRFRCHDGNHKAEGDRTIKANDCYACHTILAQGTGAELAATKSKLNELSSAFGEHKTATGNELAAIGKETTALRNVLAEVQASLAGTAARLNETVEKLKKSFFVGGKFK